MLTKAKQMSESMILGVLLTLAGGFQDAYSYNCRGGVFANAQTGNIVLLGQNLAAGEFTRAIRYLFPLLAFVAGVYIAERLRLRFRDYRALHWRQMVLGAEIVILVSVAFMPQSFNIPANVLLSFACAMQVVSFSKFEGIPCATTMCIGNLRSGTELLCRYRVTRDPALKKKSFRYFFMILIFAVGASVGAILSGRLGGISILFAAGLMGLGFILMFIREEEEKAQG